MDLLLFCWCTVKGGAADTEVLGDGDFGFTGSGPPRGLLHSLWGQGAFTPLVLAGFLRQGDALGLRSRMMARSNSANDPRIPSMRVARRP